MKISPFVNGRTGLYRPLRSLGLGVLIATGAASAPAQQTWTGTNWSAQSPALAPYTIGSGATASSSTTLWFRNTGSTSNLDGTYNLQNIRFFQSAYSGTSGYTIQGTGAIVLSPNGSIAYNAMFLGSNITQAVNAPVYLGGDTVFSNLNSPNRGNVLSFGGSTIQGLVTSNSNTSSTLTLYGIGAGNISSSIQDGQGQGSLTGIASIGLRMISSSTWTLSGTNAYTGATTVQGGGTLALDYRTNNTNKISSSSSLLLGGTSTIVTGAGSPNTQTFGGGGTLAVIGNNSAATAQSAGGVTLGLGGSTISVTSGQDQNASLSLGNITRQSGSAVNFVLNNTGTGVASISTSYAGASNGIVGSWAVVNGSNWAALSGGNIVAYNSYTNDAWASGANTNVTQNDTVTAGTTNSLRFNAAQDVSLTLSGTNVIESGGILIGSGVGAHTTSINGGTITTASNRELIINQYNEAGLLNIGSNIQLGGTDAVLTKAGEGSLLLSGNNTFSGSSSNTVNVLGGTLQVGSDTALGTGNVTVQLTNPGSTLDLNGHSISLANLNSYNIATGQAAGVDQGLGGILMNSAVGTNATLTTNFTSGTRWFMGDMTESSGAILSVSKTGNGGTWFVGGPMGSNSVYNGFNDGNTFVGSQLPQYTFINGNVSVTGTTSRIGFLQNFYTLGTINVGAGATIGGADSNSGHFPAIASSYLTGSGTVDLQINRTAYYLNVGGSAANVFDGQVSRGRFVTNGAGTFRFSAAQSGVSLATVTALGASTVELSALTASTGDNSGNNISYPIVAGGKATIKLTGTSGTIAGVGSQGRGAVLNGGTLWIAPSGSGQNVEVSGLSGTGSGTGAQLFYGNATSSGSDSVSYTNVGGNGTILLDKGANTSLKFTIGNAANTAQQVVRSGTGTLIIGAAGGLAGLGTTEKFTLLGGGTSLPAIANGMISPTIVGMDASSGDYGRATFLTYSGTGLSSDAGFVAANYSGTNFSAATTNTSVELVNAATSISGSNTVYALRNDSTLANSGTLTVAGGGSGSQAGLILNNASITNTAGTLSSGTAEFVIYTSGTSTIENAISTTGGLTLFGPGTLKLAQTANLSYSGVTTLNSGTLDVGAIGRLSSTSNLQIKGGVLQGTGTFSRSIGTGPGNFQMSSGGFAASSSAGLLVRINNSNATLNWAAGPGSNNTILTEGGVLTFGSTTAQGVVDFQNGLNLGFTGTYSGNAYNLPATGFMLRNIEVIDNVNSSLDWAVISGAISSSVEYMGISKSGDGALYLTGNNTYQGPTHISHGSLWIGADSNLGTAPIAGYDLIGTATQGAVVINGGAKLGLYNNFALSSNRSILLASGTAGNVASQIEVSASNTVSFGGKIGNYVGEIGSLRKTGAGTLVLSGDNEYTGETIVTEGTLVVNGSIASSSLTTVQNGASLEGNGEVGALVANNGSRVAPGNGDIGQLSAASFVWNGGAVMSFQLSLLDNASDIISLSGAFTQGSAGSYVFNFSDTGRANALYTLFEFDSTTFADASSFSYTGLADGLQGDFILSGNSLQFQVVPEPSTTILFALALGALFFRSRVSSRRSHV